MVQRKLLTLMALAAAIGGCLDTQLTESPNPSPTIAPVVRAIGANFTDCQGSETIFEVPADWVADDVPANYTALRYFLVGADLALRLNACAKAAIDGVDVGPASFSVLGVSLGKPASSDVPKEIDWSYYVLELRTDNPRVADWFARLGMRVANATVIHSYADLPSYWGELRSEMKGPEMLYQVHAVTTDPTFPDNEQVRYFYGPNPAVNYFDEAAIWLRGDPYPGDFQASENSELARILGHPIPASPFVTAMASLQSVIEPRPADQNDGVRDK